LLFLFGRLNAAPSYLSEPPKTLIQGSWHGIRFSLLPKQTPMHTHGANMPLATMTETSARPNSPSFTELIRFVHRQTQQQVRELAIHQREGRMVVTGRADTYYAKQMVTQAILTAAPAVQLVNEISVG
jgi:hypothetical protein